MDGTTRSLIRNIGDGWKGIGDVEKVNNRGREEH